MPRSRVELEELIVAANVRATQACRDHDLTAEWLAEADWWDLIVERDRRFPPRQRKSVEP